MKAKISQKKGFTIAELAVALAVTIVLLGSIVTLLSLVINQAQQNEQDAKVVNDLTVVRTTVHDWFYTFFDYDADQAPCVLQAVDATNCGVLVCRDAENVGEINYDAETKVLSMKGASLSSIQLEVIDDIRFTIYEKNVMKVSVWYNGKSTPVVYLLSPAEY